MSILHIANNIAIVVGWLTIGLAVAYGLLCYHKAWTKAWNKGVREE